MGHTARRSCLQQEKLVMRVGRNANAGARGYMVSSLSFSPAPHVAGVKKRRYQWQRLSPPAAGNKAVRV